MPPRLPLQSGNGPGNWSEGNLCSSSYTNENVYKNTATDGGESIVVEYSAGVLSREEAKLLDRAGVHDGYPSRPILRTPPFLGPLNGMIGTGDGDQVYL